MSPFYNTLSNGDDRRWSHNIDSLGWSGITALTRTVLQESRGFLEAMVDDGRPLFPDRDLPAIGGCIRAVAICDRSVSAYCDIPLESRFALVYVVDPPFCFVSPRVGHRASRALPVRPGGGGGAGAQDSIWQDR
jgi:hypothetical protein